MIPWIATAWTVILLTALGASVLRAKPTWVRLFFSLVAIGALTFSIVPLVGSPLQPAYSPDLIALTAFSEKAFVACWWLLVARIVIHAGQLALGINSQRHAARLLADLAAAAIYLAALLAVIDLVFGISVTGLVATSGVIAIVLGLALQSTLSDLFSGIAIGIDRPFGVGDLVHIEGAAEGRIIETNWRSTRIATGSNDIATVPNSVVAKSRITNRSAPSEVHSASVKVMLDSAVPPAEAVAMLQASVQTTASLPADTPPSVACIELRGEGTVYDIQFSVPLRTLRDASSDLLNQIARHARYHAIALAPHDGTLLKPVVAPDRRGLLQDIVILAALGEAERAALANDMIRHDGEPGQSLFVQGGSLASMFIIARGVLEVTRDSGHGPHRLGVIGPGDFFGELALLTGSPNAATVTALTSFVAYEVTKPMVAPLLNENPDLLVRFERAASKAQALLDRTIAAEVCRVPPATVHLIDRMRAFFGLTLSRGHIESLDHQGPASNSDITPERGMGAAKPEF